MPSKPLKAIQPMFKSLTSWKIVRGDKVQVMVGRDKGKQGEVLRVIRDQRFPRLFVSGVNMVTRHIRSNMEPNGTKIPGYIVKLEAPVHYSNVMLLDPEANKPVRVAFAYEDQPPYKRVRMTRGKHASNCVVPWPQKWKQDLQASTKPGDKDTRPEDAEEVTYNPAADFMLSVPAAHKRLRELRDLRDAAAAAAATAQRQPQRGSTSSSSSSSRDTSISALGSRRGYHTSSSTAVEQSQQVLSSFSISAGSSSSSSSNIKLSLLQSRWPFSGSSSRHQLLCSGGICSTYLQGSWWGLAASPWLV